VWKGFSGWRPEGGWSKLEQLTGFPFRAYGFHTGIGSSYGFALLLVFQNFLYPSYLAIFQADFDPPVVFGSTGQNVFYISFCQLTGALVFF
jgi:hypothetical protein